MKEKTEFVESIVSDVEWLGAKYDGDIKFASNYFDQMYEAAVLLIKKGKAYVCDLSPEQIREYRGTLTEPGKDSPYRNRSIEENLDLFERMKNLEFEDHRPLYDWVVQEIGYEHPPKQIEFAKLYLTNVITGKRYIKRLVDEGIVDGWDDPRLVTIAALRRRGFTPESIKSFMELVGVTKSNSSNDYAMLEYCIRNDLKPKAPRVMAVLDPIKLVIDNYPEGQVEYLDAMVNMENPDLGYEKVPFERELWIDRDDFMEEPPKKYFRLFPGNEVRLMNAYFVKCVDFEKDENGKVTVVHCTYDPITKNGTGFTGRKVKGTIHWVPVHHCKKVTARLYENLVDEEKGVYNEDGSLNLNPNSLTVIEDCYVEPAIEKYKPGDSFQFVRNGYFCIDTKDSTDDHFVFNRIVSLKSSFKLPKK